MNSPILRSLTAIAVLYGLISCVTIDETGKSAFMLMSPQQETALGASAFNDIKTNSKLSTNADAIAQVRRVVDRLTPHVNAPYVSSWEAIVIDDPTPNAFALPGGKIGVHTGILPITQTDAGLAAVIGHELAHVSLRHGGQRVSQQLAVGVGLMATDVALAMNDNQQRPVIISALGAGASVGVILPFSRSNELEADRWGMTYMARAGYDPAEAVAF